MDKKEIEQKVKEILADKLDIDTKKITLDSHLVNDLGMDSFGSVELIYELEENFKVEINEDEMMKIKTVNGIVNYISHFK